MTNFIKFCTKFRAKEAKFLPCKCIAAVQQTSTAKLSAFFQKFLKTVCTVRVNKVLKYQLFYSLGYLDFKIKMWIYKSHPITHWTDTVIRHALEKCQQAGTSIRKLEKKYGVPKSTLNQHIKNGNKCNLEEKTYSVSKKNLS